LLAGLACSPEAREDVDDARRSIEKAGEHLGEAADQTVDEIDAQADKVEAEMSDSIDSARDKLAKAKEVADQAGDMYLDGDQAQAAVAANPIHCASETYAVDRETVDAAIKNPIAMAGSSRFEPVSGKGFRITKVDPESPLRRLDVRPGDTLTHVDGTAVAQLQGDAVVEKLRADGAHVSFTIERNGTPVEKTLQVEG
jgi:C-terminal processing protease CtpA/Prc